MIANLNFPLQHRSVTGMSALMAGMTGVLLTVSALAQSHPLVDTGQIICYNATTSTGAVSPINPNPVETGFEGQDCVSGAAAADAVGAMYKLGGSTRPGADYTRIANDGSELPVDTALGSGQSDWACTRDNVTGLTWEVKVDNASNLRHLGHSYTWYDMDSNVNGGDAGTIGSDTTCNSTLTNCNTTAFRDAVNAVGLCGANDWRLPTADELQSLVHFGRFPGAYDATWFPNTSSQIFWSGQNYAPSASGAWVVNFNDGNLFGTFKFSDRRIRLVRGGQ